MGNPADLPDITLYDPMVGGPLLEAIQKKLIALAARAGKAGQQGSHQDGPPGASSTGSTSSRQGSVANIPHRLASTTGQQLQPTMDCMVQGLGPRPHSPPESAPSALRDETEQHQRAWERARAAFLKFQEQWTPEDDTVVNE
jgi:hypothetical protein